MRRVIGWVITAGCVGALAAVVLYVHGRGLSSIAVAAAAKEPAKAAAPKPPTPPVAPAASGEKKPEKVAYAFSDQVKVDEFAKLWQQRQATVIRMSVLKSYFQEEQATLEKLNGQFAKDYNLDVAKNYRFDNERKAILEVEGPPAEPQAAKSP